MLMDLKAGPPTRLGSRLPPRADGGRGETKKKIKYIVKSKNYKSEFKIKIHVKI
jgi:hypothetical protein